MSSPVRVFTMCVNQEWGMYMALGVLEDSHIFAIAYSSVDEALGLLVRNNPGITVASVTPIGVTL